MIGGNEANLKLVTQDAEAIKKLAALAHDLGVLIHVEGIPFGRWTAPEIETDREAA